MKDEGIRDDLRSYCYRSRMQVWAVRSQLFCCTRIQVHMLQQLLSSIEASCRSWTLCLLQESLPCCPADPTRAADFRRPVQSNKSCHYRGDFLIPVLKTSYRLLSFGDLSKNYYIGEHGKRFRVCSLSLYYQPQLRPLYMLSW